MIGMIEIILLILIAVILIPTKDIPRVCYYTGSMIKFLSKIVLDFKRECYKMYDIGESQEYQRKYHNKNKNPNAKRKSN